MELVVLNENILTVIMKKHRNNSSVVENSNVKSQR